MEKLSNVLIVAKDAHLYFFDSLDEADVISGKNLIAFTNSPLGRLKLSHYKLIIFLDSGFQIYYPKIVKNYTNAKLALFFWNHLTGSRARLLQRSRYSNLIDEYYSFDPIEAKKHNIFHNSTFYKPCITLEEKTPKYDLFFGGNNKGRSKIAQLIMEECQKREISLNLFIVEGDKGHDNKGYIPYKQFLNFLVSSKGILEIMQKDQTGLTLRTMESLFFKKKLVTTNQAIKHYKFYHPNNIFILGVDPIDKLPEFMKKDYYDLDIEQVNFFNPYNWIQRFFIPTRFSLLEEYHDSLLSLQ
ncbi:hexosyltransferase [Lactococcus taiwanensis]|uniref:Hexosyltransferase n=1 Tax=Lactococcus taiwanensis TaxID=1151742 RepID=A0AA45KEU2_9LACT|nr:hexosyltransferase [Lactococcus taiwanensis]QSE76030.1 hexosyltransferase [Lactococcus taiwanensis]